MGLSEMYRKYQQEKQKSQNTTAEQYSIQIGSSNKYLSRETLIRDIAQCARRSYISEDTHLTSAGLYGS